MLRGALPPLWDRLGAFGLSARYREQPGPRQRRKLRETIVFYKKRPARVVALPQLAWLLVLKDERA